MRATLVLLVQFILRGLVAEKARALFAVVGIALGVGSAVGIHLANKSVIEAFETATGAVAGEAALRIEGVAGPFDEMLLADMMWLQDVGSASPVVEGFLWLPDADAPDAIEFATTADEAARVPEFPGRLVRCLGVDVLADRPVRSYRLLRFAEDGDSEAASGWSLLRILAAPDAIVLTERLARERGLTIGDPVTFLVDDREVPMVVRGLLVEEGPARAYEGSFALLDIATAQHVFQRAGQLDAVDLELPEEADLAEATRRVQAQLPPGLRVESASSETEKVESMVAAFHFNLQALGSLALLVGLFLIYSTASFSVLRRRREIGRLRAVGCGRRMVLVLFLLEAALLALPGALAGLGLGILGARSAIDATAGTVQTFYVAEAAQLAAQASPLSFLEGLVVVGGTVLLSMLAAAVPALEATRVPPTATASPLAEGGRGLGAGARAILVTVLLVAAYALAQLPAWNGLPLAGYAAALAVLFASALVVPAALALGCRVIEKLVGRSPRHAAEAMLARASLQTSTHRVATSVAALSMALAMTVAIAIMVSSFRDTVVGWLDQALSADIYARPVTLQSAVGRATVSPEVARLFREDPDVVAVDEFVRRDLDVRGRRVTIGARDLEVLAERGGLVMVSGGAELLRRAAAEGEVLISESFAYRFGVAPGEQLELETVAGEQPFRVAGVYREYADNRGFVLVDHALYAEHFATGDGAERASDLGVFLREGADVRAVRDRLRAKAGRALFMRTASGVRAGSLAIFDSTFAITGALQAIAVAVAALGIVSTLLTLLVERCRELAILQFLGTDRRRVRGMLVLEAIAIALAGQVLGVVVGCILAALLIYVINLQSFGWAVVFQLPVGYLLSSTLFVLLAAAVAALYPAARASRVQSIHFAAEG